MSETSQVAKTRAPPGVWDPEQSIPQRFEFIARLHATDLAVADGDVSLSYGELDQLANRIAGVLRTLSPDWSSPIAICLPHGAAHIASTLGVLKAGGFYLPLDPHSPAERNDQLLRDAAARIIITDDRHHMAAAALALEGHRIVNLDQLEETAASESAEPPVAPTALAYVLYTSGSTGKPKGVMHTHRNVLHNALRHADVYGISPLDRQTLLYAPTVYGGQRDMYNALLSGASLHVYAVKQHGMVGLKEWLASRQITIYCSVTTVFRHLCDTLAAGDQFAHLRLIKLGGEASYRTDVERFKRHFSAGCSLHCGLGSTETGLARSFFVRHSTPVAGDTVPLGYPVTGMQVLVCDETGSPVADGVTGEIAIRSQYVALGYWRDPALTQAAFVSDPGDDRYRTYFTGDLGVIRPDGCLEHRGRRDFQIKIRGNRIEPAEVEIALLREPGVREAAVVAWKADGSIDKLVAFLVAADGRRPTTPALRDALAKHLPDHMVPSHFFWLDVLPTLANGKLDRKSLTVLRMPVPVRQGPAATPPDMPQESRLCAVWRDILDIQAIGVHDNFFELGGDSLAAMILLTRLDEEFGLDISPATFADNATIQDLARLMSGKDQGRRFPVLVPVRTSGDRAPIFCVHGIFGSPLILRSLAPHLAETRPLFEFSSPRLDGRAFSFASLESLAAFYLREMRQRQAHGPYLLCGFSFGGLVALELAHQLTAAGEQVALLVIVDSNPPTLASSVAAAGTLQGHATGWHRQFKKLGVRTSLASARQQLHEAAKDCRHLLTHVVAHCGIKVPVRMRREYLRWNHARLMRAYRPDIYAGNVDVYFTAARERRLKANWTAATTGKVRFFPITGEHSNLHQAPFVTDFARAIEQRLADLDTVMAATAPLPRQAPGLALD